MRFRLKIGKQDLLEKVLYLMLIVQVMGIRWLNLTRRYSYIFLLLLLFQFISRIRGYRKIAKGFFWFLIILVYFWYSAYNNTSVGMQNFKLFFPSLCVFVFVGYLIGNRKETLSRFFYKCAWLFNVYYFVNIPALMIELGGNLALAGKHPDGVVNPMKEDLICGLLGYNGTPLLGLYTAFMTVLNIDIYGKIKNKNYRVAFGVYNIIVLAFMLWISTKNDNKTCFLLIALFVAIYKLYDVYRGVSQTTVDKIKGIAKYIIFAIASICVVYNVLIRIEATNKILTSIMTRITEGLDLGAKATGSAERIGAVVYILGDPIHHMLGYGLGNYTWRQNGAFGFYHFGQNDLSVFLMLGGIVFVALILLMIYFITMDNIKSNLLATVMVVLFLILMTYTQLVTEFSSTCILAFFYTLCCLKCKEGDC